MTVTFGSGHALIKDFIPPAGNGLPIPVNPELEFEVLVLCAFLGHAKSEKIQGPDQHAFLRRMLSLQLDEKSLRDFAESISGRQIGSRLWDSCRQMADKWKADGISVAGTNPCGGEQRVSCPAVFFIKGDPHNGTPGLAVFNSRKPLAFSPDTDWIEAIRFILKEAAPERLTYLSSAGTLTYELVAAHARHLRLPLVMAAPFSILEPLPDDSDAYRWADGILSCLPSTNSCPKRKSLVCRDRILAQLARLHVVIELRSGGNLVSVLENLQRTAPRTQLIFHPPKRNSSNAGNFALLEKFPVFARTFSLQRPGVENEPRENEQGNVLGPERPETQRVDWDRYLYHYTRRQPGPWPGQSRLEYMREILDNGPLCGHSALDTLIRIVTSRRIRAGCKLIRGREAVISWSSHPPTELCDFRRWNTALARWTVEPYGIAVSRRLLRSIGAKPAIYGGNDVYRKLPRHEIFRFQSSSGASSWRNEREWRFPGDLELDKLNECDWFAFVPGCLEKKRLIAHAGPAFRVTAFNPFTSFPEGSNEYLCDGSALLM